MDSYFTKYRLYLVLVCFFVVALFLRLWALGAVPGGFHEDEAHIGYNAYALLKTAHDKNNVFLPLAIDQFGDFRPSGLHFLTIPSVMLFGLTEFATRFPVALFGALSVVVFYLLSYEIFKKKTIALLASGIMVINPWHFIASRSTSESIVALFFVMFGIYALLVFLRKTTVWIFILALLLLLLSFQFYHAARYFMPFLLVAIAFWVTREKSLTKKIKLTLVIGILILFGVLMVLFRAGSGSGRVQEVSIFTHPATSIELWNQRTEDKNTDPLLVRFFHNKVVGYTYTAMSNYSQHFTPDFLFFKGGYPQRYMVPWYGNYYLLDALFILIGFSVLLTTVLHKKHESWLVFIPFVWLAVGPLPAAFTFEDIPHFQRAIMMLPALLLFAAYGMYVLLTIPLTRFIRSLLLVLTSVIFLFQLLLFMHNYFHHTLTHNARYRNEGEKELVLAMNEYKKQKRNIIMTSEGANHIIFYLFHNKFDPAVYQKLGSPRDSENLFFDRALFTRKTCPSYSARNELLKKKFNTIYVDLGECLPTLETKLIKVIKRFDGTVAFRILEIKPEAIVKIRALQKGKQL